MIRPNEEHLRAFEKYCPKLVHAIRRKRYLPRREHQGLYANQEELNADFELKLIHMILDLGQQQATQKVENMVCCAALDYQRPMLFLEPGLGEALRETDMHEDFTTADIHMPWPAFRVMLSKGLVQAKSEDGTSMALRYIDAFLWEGGQPFDMRYEQAAELAEFSSRVGEPLRAEDLVNWFSAQQKYSCMYLVAGTDYRAGPEFQPDVLTSMVPWRDGSELHDLIVGDGRRRLEGSLIDGTMNPSLMNAARALLWQVLLHLSGPVSYKLPEDDWIRKPKLEGKHLKPGLLRARYVGDLRPELWKEPVHREKAEPTGATKAWHWVRGHRRRQHYGPRGSLTKLVWIKPYRTGEALEDAV
jgi:hypothetical protein